jgi:hypothetical protein
MEQIQNKIDEKFKLIEEQQEDMKSTSDSIRLLRKFPDTPTLDKEIKMKITCDLLESIAITSENTSVLNREIETLMNELMELFKKDTAEKFRELGAEVVGDYNE